MDDKILFESYEAMLAGIAREKEDALVWYAHLDKREASLRSRYEKLRADMEKPVETSLTMRAIGGA